MSSFVCPRKTKMMMNDFFGLAKFKFMEKKRFMSGNVFMEKKKI